MTGRHSSRHGKSRRLGLRVPLPLVVGAVALALIGAAAAVGLTLRGTPEGAATGIDCEGSLYVAIAAAPSVAPVVETLADEHTSTRPSVDGICVSLAVESRPSAEVAESLAAGTNGAPALWIPDGTRWATQVGAQIDANDLGPIATSPVVVVAPRPVAEQLGWPDKAFSWQSVLSEQAQAAIIDPVTSSEGMATLLAVRTVLGEAGSSPEQLVGAMTRVSNNVLDNSQSGFDQLAADPGKAPLFTATEQAVMAHNGEHPESPAVALYPSEGTHIISYPALSMTTGSEQARVATAVDAFVALIHSAKGEAALFDAGFRSPDGTASEDFSLENGVVGEPPTVLAEPNPEEAAGLMRQWSALTLKARLLAVMDVSGSMREEAPGGRTRIELAVEAAKSALGLFPDGSDIGLWAFSILQAPPRDYIELVSLGPVGENLNGVPRRQALVQAVDSLPGRARGGTGLYDTALAAFRAVRNTYDPAKVNSVVLMTDGKNEDDNGIDLQTLLNTLRTEADPAQPVPLITIGIGPDADMDALTKMAEVTGGKAYSARDPNDIKQVFLDAMVERQCRPNC